MRSVRRCLGVGPPEEWDWPFLAGRVKAGARWRLDWVERRYRVEAVAEAAKAGLTVRFLKGTVAVIEARED